MNFELVFDNGGGMLLQTENYVHFYDNPSSMDVVQIADDIRAVLNAPDGTHLVDDYGWEGNEPEFRLVEEDYQWCKVYSDQDIREAMAANTPLPHISGASELAVLQALCPDRAVAD